MTQPCRERLGGGSAGPHVEVVAAGNPCCVDVDNPDVLKNTQYKLHAVTKPDFGILISVLVDEVFQAVPIKALIREMACCVDGVSIDGRMDVDARVDVRTRLVWLVGDAFGLVRLVNDQAFSGRQ